MNEEAIIKIKSKKDEISKTIQSLQCRDDLVIRVNRKKLVEYLCLAYTYCDRRLRETENESIKAKQL